MTSRRTLAEESEAHCSTQRSCPSAWMVTCQHVFDPGVDRDVQHVPGILEASRKATPEVQESFRPRGFCVHEQDLQDLPNSFAASPKATPETNDSSQRELNVHGQLCSLQEELCSRMLNLDRKLDDLNTVMCSRLDGVCADISRVKDTCAERSPRRRRQSVRQNARQSVATAAQVMTVTQRPKGRKSVIVEQAGPPQKETPDYDACRSGSGLGDVDAADSPTSRDSRSSLRSLSGSCDRPRRAMRGSATFTESIAIIKRMRGELSGAQTIWTFLEDPDSTIFARLYEKFRAYIIVLSVIATLLMTLHPVPLPVSYLYAFNLILDMVFMVETSIRYCVSRSTRLFIKSPNNVCDIVGSLLPLIVNIPCLFIGLDHCTAEDSTLQMLRICVPVLRLIKALRHFRKFHLFLCLVEDIQEALGVLMLILGIIVLSCASIVYLVEPRENIETFPIAMYFIVTTVSTVGYGDYSPTTSVGTAVVSGIIFISILFMALPLGIIGNAFTQIWQERDKILLTLRTQERLEQWGYTAEDLKKLLKHFDTNGDGELNMVEFLSMIREMRIGIDRSRVVALFELFDKDGSGAINSTELCRALFPANYHDIVQDAVGPEVGNLVSDFL